MKAAYEKKYLKIIFSDSKRYFILFFLLRFLSLLYGAVIAILRRRRSKHRYKSKKPVLSIGNITWGGTGKTPLTIELGNYIKSAGFKLGVIHHGRAAGDEITLLKQSISGARVLQSTSKLAALMELERDSEIEIILIDDGYQNWNIVRDLNILCLNFKNPFGNGFLIPRGSLRERCSAISRADIIMINKARDQEDFIYTSDIKRHNSYAPLIFTRYNVKELYDVFNQTQLCMQDISGITASFITAVADPEYVKAVLINMNLDIRDGFIYPDHHVFKEEDLVSIKDSIADDVKAIFITEKDYVKIKDNLEFAKDVFSDKLLILFKIGLEYLDNEKTLFRRLDILLDSLSG
ncbi:MAG: tetraacyldisaccharide 4'-kinase [Candidatus Kaelpia aquatica]|nr:tetraacyldisaccharide 4'-kinase [Candidatus Kaelpia aquatica]